MGGSISQDSQGVYGTLGTPATANAPGSRYGALTWTDNHGNLWLFGGFGIASGPEAYYGFLNDLWEYNPASGEWTWMSGSNSLSSNFDEGAGAYGTLGVAASGNVPPGRYGAVTWVDNQGNLWLFGGRDYALSDYFNDLWEYSTTSKMWTWMGGSEKANQAGVYGTSQRPASGNTPGARFEAVSWTDSNGNFWLFGGDGMDSTGALQNLNDLWEYNPATSQWTWMAGSNTAGQATVPGTKGTPAQGNTPGARQQAAGWTDHQGNLWLFGGTSAEGNLGDPFGYSMNDLWEFIPAKGEWAWISGGTAPETTSTVPPGVYGSLQVSAAGNVPGARTSASTWIDGAGNLWLFGGDGYDSAGNQVLLDDLWEFNPASSHWTWMGGDSIIPNDCASYFELCGESGEYGILQTPGFGNGPGSRRAAATWTDSKGNFWLFGGYGFDGEVDLGPLSDLWEFQPNTGSQPVAATPQIAPGSGTYGNWQDVTISDTTPGATIYYLIDGAPPAIEYSGPIVIQSTQTIEAMASATGFANSNIASASYRENLSTAPAPVFSVAAGNYASAQTVNISDSTPGASIYYAIGAEPTAAFALYNGGPIAVSSSETLQAYAVAENYMNSNVTVAAYNIGANPSAEWAWMGGVNAFPPACSKGGSCAVPGWFGTLRTPAASNLPGARSNAATWRDDQGNFWLFGGWGWDSAGDLGFLNDLWKFNPSTAEWTWMAGGNTVPACTSGDGCGQSGNYGTPGTPNANNSPGGRQFAASWMDANGNFWLFGGAGIDANGVYGFLNDLWKFNPSSNQWTWMGGSDSVSCLACGRAGVYGQLGEPAATNQPGGRAESLTWTDNNGNFWMFGGLGEDDIDIECFLNDLWEFNPSTNEWTWMGGYPIDYQRMAGYQGIYGDVGVPAAGNLPWSYTQSSTWTDSAGHLWLFGGMGEDDTETGYYLNDMWEFYPSLDEWAYTSANSGGAPGGSSIGVYGTMGSFAPPNVPGERYGSARWSDKNGNFWLLGGVGVVNNNLQVGALNDLWEFQPSINEWAWMNGSSSIPYDPSGNPSIPPQFGTLGTAAPENTPGGRAGAATWTDSSGNLWLFGGGGLNDVWEYDLAGPPIVLPPSPAGSPTFRPPAGTYTSVQTLTISAPTAGSTIYYTTDGTAPDAGSAVYSTAISISGTETVNAVAVASGHAVSPIASAVYTINLPQASAPAFSIPGGSYTSAQTVTITDAISGASIYYTTDGSTPTVKSTPYSGPITVAATETIKAIAAANGYSNSTVESATYTIVLPPTFAISVSPSTLTTSLGGLATTTVTITPENGFNSSVTFACGGLPAGASCNFNPFPVTPTLGPVTSTLTITAETLSASNHDSRPSLPGTALAFAVFFLAWRKRRAVWLAVLIAVAITGSALMAGCGGGGGTGGGGGGSGSTPVTSTVTVTATSGALQQSTTITLTVN